MIVTIRHWYAARSGREQTLLLALLAIAVVLVAWLLVILPLRAAYASALEKNLAATDRHGRILALTEAARKAPPRPPVALPSSDMTLVVGDSARGAACHQRGGDDIDCALARQAMHELGDKGDLLLAQLQHAVFANAGEVKPFTCGGGVPDVAGRRQVGAINALEYGRLAAHFQRYAGAGGNAGALFVQPELLGQVVYG